MGSPFHQGSLLILPHFVQSGTALPLDSIPEPRGLTSSSLGEVGGVGAEPPHKKPSITRMPVKRFFLYDRLTRTGLKRELQVPRFRHCRGDRKKASSQGLEGGDLQSKYYPSLDSEASETEIKTKAYK